MKPHPSLPFRLMSVDEVRETRQEIADWWQINKDICLLWSDDQSSYAGIYISDYLKDKICFIDHEECDSSPAFRDIFSFYESLPKAYQAGQDWHEC